MDDYNKLFGMVNNHLEKDDVITDNEIISLYDLYILVKSEIESLDNEIKFLLYEMQNNYCNNRLKNMKKMLFNISVYSFDNETVIYFSYYDRKSEKTSYESIRKKYKNSDIDIENSSVSIDLINKYYDKIMKIFDIKEMHYFEYEVGVNKIVEKISDELFDVSISYNKYLVDDINIRVKEEIDYNNIYDKERLILKSIKSIVDESLYEILKKIVVRIDELDNVTRNIINKKIKFKNKTLIKK